MDASTSSALQGCVTSLRSGMQLLESSINILDEGVRDYPRLGRVLQTTRHFELVSEPDLVAAQATLQSEIQPEIENLFSRVETYLEKLERRERGLMAKADLQEGRLARESGVGSAGSRGKAKVTPGGDVALGKMEELRMQQLRQKKERLSYAVGRLEMQANQRQRQLRKSMAAQGDAPMG